MAYLDEKHINCHAKVFLSSSSGTLLGPGAKCDLKGVEGQPKNKAVQSSGFFEKSSTPWTEQPASTPKSLAIQLVPINRERLRPLVAEL